MKGFIFSIVVIIFVTLCFSTFAAAMTDNEAINTSTKFILEHSKPVHYGILITEYKVDAKEVSRVDSDTFVSLEIYSYVFGFRRSRDLTIKLNDIGDVTAVYVMKAQKTATSFF